jgi:hypothetical protein
MKINCWQFKACGREPGGQKTDELGVCPATTDTRLNGTHGGMNAGRACWITAGTLCGDHIQGTFAIKFKSCEICDFYQMVRSSEGAHFQLAILLLNRLTKDAATISR